MTKLAIIHTTPATIESLKSLAYEIIPHCEVINFVDDSILGQLLESEGDLSLVEERLLIYAKIAQKVGADILLEACSSIGELAKEMQKTVSIPVVRIDDAMAAVAVSQATHIGVAATLKTTLMPTIHLLNEKAHQAGKSIEISHLLINEAFQALSSGDRTKHDQLLIKALDEFVKTVDVVVLAQASMASVLDRISGEREKFFTSPRLAMETVKRIAEGYDSETKRC